MKKLILLTLISPLLLSSCGQETKNKNAIYAMNGYNGPKEVTTETVLYMMKCHYAFPLLLHVDGCEHCEVAKGVVNQYASNYHKQIFTCEVNAKNNQILAEAYPLLLSGISYPTFYIMDTYGLHYEVSNYSLKNYANFKKEVHSQFRDSSFSYANSLSEFNSLTSNKNNYLIFTYDSSSTDYDQSYFKLFQTGKKKKKDVIIIDEFYAESSLISYLFENFSLSGLHATWFENGQIKTTIKYLEDEGGYDNLLKTFLDTDTIISSF